MTTLGLVVAVFATAVVASGVAADLIGKPRHVRVSGVGHYDVGRKVGAQVADLIAAKLATNDTSTQLIPFARTNAAALAANASMFAAAQKHFPHLIDELRGVADGSGIDFADIFLLVCAGEMWSLWSAVYPNGSDVSAGNLRRSRVPGSHPHGHCTDVFSYAPRASPKDVAIPVWGHNEDAGPDDVNTTYLVTATIRDPANKKNILERFTVYAYAAQIGGSAWGFNTHGIIVSTNTLFAVALNFYDADAVPHYFHNRAALAARTVKEAIALSTAVPTIAPFNLNVGTVGALTANHYGVPTERTRFYTVEVDPFGPAGVTPVYPPSGKPTPAWIPGSLPAPTHHHYHANDYLTLTTPQDLDPSSEHRLTRLLEFPVPHSTADIRQMLGDTKDPLYPLYRTGNADDAFTVSTFVLHVWPANNSTDEDPHGPLDGEVWVYHTNPKANNGTEPGYKFSLTKW